MSFVYPMLFWMLMIPFAVFVFLILTNKERLSRIFDENVLARLSADSDAMPQRVRNIVILAAVFLMIVALARPVIDKGEQKIEVEGLSLLTALDISGSMRSKDLYPNRLEFAKKKMEAFFDAMPGDEIGVIAFAYNAFVIAPFTNDKETLKMMVDAVDDSYISESSTNFEAMGDLSATLLKKKKPKILVVFSDGGDKEALKEFQSLLKENGIDLYAVLIGTAKGAPVVDQNGKPVKKRDGAIAITQRNDLLGKLTEELGGAYVIAGNGKSDMQKLASVIHSRYKAQHQGEVKVKQRVELFYYPLAFGLLFLLIGFSSIPRMKQKGA